MKYAKDDCRSRKPGEVVSVGPRFLTDGYRTVNGMTRLVPNMYYVAPGFNRHERRKIDAVYRHEYGKLAYAAMVKERKANKKKVLEK